MLSSSLKNCCRFLIQQSSQLTTFSYDLIKPYVPRVWLYFLDSLAFKCKPEQLWAEPVFLVFQKVETTIKIAAAHTDTISTVIKSNNRCDNEVDFPQRNLRTSYWLPKTVSIFLQLCLRCQLYNAHAEVIFDDFAGIDLVLCRQVTRGGITCSELVHALSHLIDWSKAPPACAVTNRRSRTGATGGVSRGSNRLTVETALLKCYRQCTTPR